MSNLPRHDGSPDEELLVPLCARTKLQLGVSDTYII